MNLLQHINKKRRAGHKSLAVLIDPDTTSSQEVARLVSLAHDAHVDYFFVGGSRVKPMDMDLVLGLLQDLTDIPIVIFPGSSNQLSEKADALLFLSLISGRNPEFLIGKHVESALFLHQSNLEVIPTGYMLIDGGNVTSVAYVSNTTPIPHDKINIAISTALAGQFLGMKLIYLEGGSGAHQHVSPAMTRAVKEALDIPLIVGGGIRNPESAAAIAQSGADIIVIGNILEKDPELMIDLSAVIHATKTDSI